MPIIRLLNIKKVFTVPTEIRNNWSREEVLAIMQQPMNDLLFQAQTVHREFHDPNAVQISQLLSIKTGTCPEDCTYCPQSIRYNTGLSPEALMEVKSVVEQAKAAKDSGASRFCMGAAWRSPKDRDMPKLMEMVRQVKGMGMETCMTLGMLSPEQANDFSEAGLDYYNHNLDTSEEYKSLRLARIKTVSTLLRMFKTRILKSVVAVLLVWAKVKAIERDCCYNWRI